MDSVCLNHPDRPAVSRCTTCFKPICGECIERVHGEEFCSEQCAANYEGTRSGVTEFEERHKQRRAARFRRRVIVLVVLAVAGYFGYRYVKQNPNAVGDIKRKAEEARKAVQQKAKQLNQ